MANGIRTSDPRGLNKRRGSKFSAGFRVRQETPEEGRRTSQLKRCEYNNKVHLNSPETLNDKKCELFFIQFHILQSLFIYCGWQF